MAPAGFSEQLQTISQAHRDFPSVLARYKKDPQDVEAAGRLAVIYAGPRLVEKGNGAIEYQRNRTATPEIDEGPEKRAKPTPSPSRQKP